MNAYEYRDAQKDVLYLKLLKSKRSWGFLAPPGSWTEFEDDVEAYFFDWMSGAERRGFEALKMVFRNDASVPEAARLLKIDEEICRDEIGRFCNIVAWMMPPSAMGDMNPSLSAALRCEIRREERIDEIPDRKHRAPCTYVDNRLARAPEGSAAVVMAAMDDCVIRMLVGKASKRVGMDEARQEALIVMVGAMSTYDPDKGPLMPYLRTCVKLRLYTLLGDPRRQRLKCKSIDDTAPHRTYPVPLKYYLPARNTAVKTTKGSGVDVKMASGVMNRLTKLEMAVLRGKVVGLEYRDIARRLCIDEKSVDNAMSRICQKFKTNARTNTARKNGLAGRPGLLGRAKEKRR